MKVSPMIPTQAHIGTRITALRAPIDEGYSIPTKPPAAFWTVDAHDNDAIERLITHIGVDDTTHHTLVPVRIPEPKIFDLSDIHQLWNQLKKWRFIPLATKPDSDKRAMITQIQMTFVQHSDEIWDTIAQMYDAVRLTSHPSAPGFLNRMGWDIPSTAWFRPQDSLQLTNVRSHY